jgi:thioredoxin reductase (NADPH)
MLDLVIIGAGPAGISAAYEAQKLGLSYIALEKGLIADTVYNYPIGLTVFSTTNELEFTPGALQPAREKPTREELLSYYVRFALENELKINTEEEVVNVEKLEDETFRVRTTKATYEGRRVLFTIGGMAHPRHLNVRGEDLPKVHHIFRETYPYVRKHALVIGGGNSAGEAALFLAEEGAEATLATFRADWENTDPKQGCIKHWVKQPLEEQLQKKCLNVFFLGSVVEIREKDITLESEDGEIITLPNDVVFVLIGADADLTLLKNLGVETVQEGKHGEIPVYNEETFETNISGVYVAGHFTHSRHIKEAIAVPRRIMPEIVKSMRRFYSR